MKPNVLFTRRKEALALGCSISGHQLSTSEAIDNTLDYNNDITHIALVLRRISLYVTRQSEMQ